MGVKMTTPLTTSPWVKGWELVESNSCSIVQVVYHPRALQWGARKKKRRENENLCYTRLLIL